MGKASEEGSKISLDWEKLPRAAPVLDIGWLWEDVVSFYGTINVFFSIAQSLSALGKEIMFGNPEITRNAAFYRFIIIQGSASCCRGIITVLIISWEARDFISPFSVSSRGTNVPAAPIEKAFVIFPRRWHNIWHKTNLVSLASGREIPWNTTPSWRWARMQATEKGNKRKDRPKLRASGELLSALVAIIRCWGMKKNRAMQFVISQSHFLLPTDSSLRFPDPYIVYMQLVILNDFVFHELKLCKRVTSSVSFGSELRWSTTHFVEPFNTSESPCLPLKFFPILQKHSEMKGPKRECIQGEPWYSLCCPQFFPWYLLTFL